MQNIEFLVAAYVVFWILIFGYTFSISRRQKTVEAEIESLKQEIGEK